MLKDVEEWQTRPLDAVYPVLYIDAVHFSVREDNITKKLAAYVILVITTDGHKDVMVICPIFKFSMPTRKIIYTTNAIESLNSCYKKLNRQRNVFPSSTALMKSLYLFTKKWYQPIHGWGSVYNEFCSCTKAECLSRKSPDSLVQYER